MLTIGMGAPKCGPNGGGGGGGGGGGHCTVGPGAGINESVGDVTPGIAWPSHS